jgi:hypothetical protein
MNVDSMRRDSHVVTLQETDFRHRSHISPKSAKTALQRFGHNEKSTASLQRQTTPPLSPHTSTTTANMPGVSVRDVQADKFIDAYAAFLKRQGRLPIPGP